MRLLDAGAARLDPRVRGYEPGRPQAPGPAADRGLGAAEAPRELEQPAAAVLGVEGVGEADGDGLGCRPSQAHRPRRRCGIGNQTRQDAPRRSLVVQLHIDHLVGSGDHREPRPAHAAADSAGVPQRGLRPRSTGRAVRPAHAGGDQGLAGGAPTVAPQSFGLFLAVSCASARHRTILLMPDLRHSTIQKPGSVAATRYTETTHGRLGHLDRSMAR